MGILANAKIDVDREYKKLADVANITFEDGKTEYVTVSKVDEAITGGHGGGDYGIVYDLYDYLNGTYSGLDIAEIGVSVQNHMIGFAAEKARLEDKVVDVQKFCEEYKFEI